MREKAWKLEAVCFQQKVGHTVRIFVKFVAKDVAKTSHKFHEFYDF